MRAEFSLPPEDMEFLAARGAPWETVKRGSQRWVLLHDLAVPTGYSPQKTLAGIQLPGGYPDTQIDMIYFCPGLARDDGTAIRGLAAHSFDEKRWQRWSRHRHNTQQWQPGVDGLSSHIALMLWALEREVSRN